MATILNPGITYDCSIPELKVIFKVACVPTDVFSLSFQIFEVVTASPTPVQVYPITPGDKQVVDVDVLCPVGGKVGTGEYVATWTVPNDEPIGTHQIKWTYKATDGANDQFHCDDFSVLEVTPGVPTPDFVLFLSRFPLLAARDSTVIELAIAEAARCINVTCLGNKAPDAKMLLAAHLVEITTNPALASGLSSAIAGTAQVSFSGGNSSDPYGLSRTAYGQAYARLLFVSGPTAGVLC